jgi:hypothetical protein
MKEDKAPEKTTSSVEMTTILRQNLYSASKVGTDHLLGGLLTLIDASISDLVQRKAFKDLVRREVYKGAENQRQKTDDILARLYKALHKDDQDTGPEWVMSSMQHPHDIYIDTKFTSTDLTK